MKPVMSPTEIALLRCFMAASTSYFEFGMGGSTCLAADLVAKNIYAVDSDSAWVEDVRMEIGTRPGKTIELSHIDIGPLSYWGMPRQNMGSEPLFPRYSQSIAAAGLPMYDLVLVDGRFRVACALQALSQLPADSVVAIHDYRTRPHYHVVEQFARLIAAVEELAFFVRRVNFDRTELEAVLAAHRRKPA